MGVYTNCHVLLELLFFASVLLLRSCSALDRFSSNYVFGDSLVDVGNNNYIATIAKSNYLQNGIDFPPGRNPTGRFCNGRTVVDIIGQELGWRDFTPAYLAPTTVGDVVLDGVNYASAASGILNGTGRNYVGRINNDAQLDYFAKTRQYIISRMGSSAASEHFGNALFSFTTGSNDFINNYLLSPTTAIFVTPETFVNQMIARYNIQLRRLYDMGARRVVVVNVGPIGCIPDQRDKNPLAGDSCVDLPNQLAILFNKKLKTLIMDLNSNLAQSKFLYGDVYSIVTDIIQNYQSYGFENFDSACCRLAGRHGGLAPCLQPSIVCPNRSKYVFWDPFHPTDATNFIIAKRLFEGGSNDIYPINIRQLMQAN
ncbi:hypothetical protein MKW98_018888 [Papaver atlanticum]|uniref:GDSL esterase/lipase n=1 Tax=Papaver atlanticum TaxID=357466 RepID=A0AAD4TIZ3_9MAGN|nr:hypothetical protein MKW98_018888 [Papaver atlanticum]